LDAGEEMVVTGMNGEFVHEWKRMFTNEQLGFVSIHADSWTIFLRALDDEPE
jgi:hypothetical protein